MFLINRITQNACLNNTYFIIHHNQYDPDNKTSSKGY